MHAKPGDVLIIEGKTVGRSARRGTIVQVPSPAGGPPYRVRWDSGQEGLVVPGPDARIEPAAESTQPL